MIFERWMTAADSLGSFWSGFAAYSVGDLANVLRVCNEPSLASQLQQDGPSALCRLDMERRGELSAKVEPTLGPGLKRLLQSEAVEMERSLGTAVPLRLVVFGRSARHEYIGPVMDREFPRQRGIALFLQRPKAAHLATFENWRHQILWPEAQPPSPKEIKNLRRLPPVREPRLMSFPNLARLRPSGAFYTSHASRPYATFDPGEILRIGGLSIEAVHESNLFPGETSEIVIASGAQTYEGPAPVVLFGADQFLAAKTPSLSGRLRVYLGNPRETYGRIDFHPLDRKLSVSVHRTRDRRALSVTTDEVHKDRMIFKALYQMRSDVAEAIAEDILADFEDGAATADDRAAARAQAGLTVDTAAAYVARYLEWIEWHPEQAATACQDKLAELAMAMEEDITPELRSVKPALLQRDLYRAFEQFLVRWGMEYAP